MAGFASGNRAAHLGQGVGNDGGGYDFGLRDEAGSMTGRPGAFCLLEVKSSTDSAEDPFSAVGERTVKGATAHGNKDEEYLILRLARVNKPPSFVDVLVEPYQLWIDNKLQLTVADPWGYPGGLRLRPSSVLSTGKMTQRAFRFVRFLVGPGCYS